MDILYTWINKHYCYPRGINKYKRYKITILPKWKKDATEFPVHVSFHEKRGYQAYLPRPIMEALGDPKFVKFVLKGKHVEVKADNDK